jgi:hypothetical protein
MFMIRIRYSRRTLTVTAGSLAAMLLLLTLTTPVSNIMLGLAFFTLMLVFLISLGYLLLGLGGRSIGRQARISVILISTFLVLAAMFQSVQSLNWATGLTLTLLGLGMLFYTSRRS